MKKICRFFLCAAIAFFFVLALSSLVDSPPLLEEMVKECDAQESNAVFSGNREVAAAAPACSQIHDTEIRSTVPASSSVCLIPKDSGERDGNGSPLSGRTYVHTAYNACPMEDMPG